MSFWDTLGRMIQGKPAFEDPEHPDKEPVSNADDDSAAVPKAPATDRFGTPIDEHGYKIIPDIKVDHIKPSRHGDDQIVTAWVRNNSDQQVRIDHVRILSQQTTINRELDPNQSHEIIIYKGRTPMSDHDHDAELVFRLTSNTDRFQLKFYVEFHRESDGGFLVEELHNNGPVRDI